MTDAPAPGLANASDAPVETFGDPVAHDHGHAHGMSDKGYVFIALILSGITAAEVAWSYLPWGDGGGLTTFAQVGGLLFMMAIKFGIVAAFFMHLRFDNKVLTRLFYAGLFLAVGVYLAALTTFELFGNGPPYTR
jgi:cytochrome c oxidase subunit 4